MAACDVWKQTHKNFKNELLSTTFTHQSQDSQPAVQELSNVSQDDTFRCGCSQSNSALKNDLVSHSIFITAEGNVIDSYDTGDDDLCSQFVKYWNKDERSFQSKIGEKLYRNIFNDLLFQGQVDLLDGEPDSESDYDDTVFGMLSSETDEDEDENYFDNTHFNCIPVLMMEWHQHQYVHNEDGIIGDAQSGMHSDITLHNGELDTMCTNDPCTINYGAHSEQQQYQIDKLDTVNDSLHVSNNSGIGLINSGANSVSVQQQQQVQLNLEIANGIIFPSGFYSLQYFLADINGMNQNNQISISLLNKLELVFVNSTNSYVYRPFIIHDDSDPGGEFISLNVLLYILEDLDIEYGDTIGVSYDVKFLFQSDTSLAECLNPFNVDNNSNNITNNQSPSHCTKQRGTIKNKYETCGINSSTDTFSNSHNCDDKTYENEDNVELSWKNYLLQTAQWIADSQDAKYCSMGDFYNDISSCCLQFGNQIGIATTSLEKLHLVFFDVDDKKKLTSATLKVNENFFCGGPPMFYPLKLLLHKVEEILINYGYLKNMAIGIEILSLNDLKILFCNDIAQIRINDNFCSLHFENNYQHIHHQDRYRTANNNNTDNNSNSNNPKTQNRSSLNFRKKRGRKKKRYKWIVKNKLQHPVSKTFGEYGSIRNSIDNISIRSTDIQSIMSHNSDYCNADNINSRVLSGQIDISRGGNSEYGSALNSIKIITAPAPPRDPDGEY